MTATRTTIAGIDGVPQAVAGIEQRTSARRRLEEAALAALALAILVLVAT